MAFGKVQRLSRRCLISLGLEACALLSQIKFCRPSSRAGFIFTLHHVRPHDESDHFKPNSHLEITPEFLRSCLKVLKDEGFDFIRMSELPARLDQVEHRRPFAIFTLDDGYRNNRDYALPVFEEFEAPATYYVTPAFAERTAIIWWEVLAELLDKHTEIAFDFGSGIKVYPLRTNEEKIHVFNSFCHYMLTHDESSAVELLTDLSEAYGIDPLGITQRLTLDRDELTEFSKHPLVDFGAHGQNHLAIGRLPTDRARKEIVQSAEWLERLTGKKPQSFAFPYGNRQSATARDFKLVQESGLEIAVTTQPGMIRTDRVAQLSALPRVSLNGYYQKPRYTVGLASGIPFRWGRT